MPIVRSCTHCGQKNRVGAAHLADLGRCGACKAELPPLAAPVEADPNLFDEVLKSATVPVLVDFWASWCGPCRVAAPEVAKTAQATAGRAVVLKVNTEKYPQLAQRYQVQGIPNFIVLRGGKLVQQQAGVVPASTMQSWLRAE